MSVTISRVDVRRRSMPMSSGSTARLPPGHASSNETEAILSNIEQCLAPDGIAIIEASTETGVRRKGSRPRTWYVADGGLFASGRHLVLSESGWDDRAQAAVERWSVIDEREQVARYESTTWLLSDSLIDTMLSEHGLRLEGRFADLTGTPHEPRADFQTLTMRAGRPVTPTPSHRPR
jgi:hypothetical protein